MDEQDGAARIAVERRRQIEVEGYTVEGDVGTLEPGQLALAAVAYAIPAGSHVRSSFWPWDPRYYKPTPGNRIRELEKAGALIAAEIDRLVRSPRPVETEARRAFAAELWEKLGEPEAPEEMDTVPGRTAWEAGYATARVELVLPTGGRLVADLVVDHPGFYVPMPRRR